MSEIHIVTSGYDYETTYVRFVTTNKQLANQVLDDLRDGDDVDEDGDRVLHDYYRLDSFPIEERIKEGI